MGLETYKGQQDHFTRYKVYKNNTDINDSISLSQNYLGILHAKDITSYRSAKSNYDAMQTRVTTATIETTDRIQLNNNYYLYCLAERTWYIIDEITEDSHNETQRYMARPITTKTITIRRK